MNAKRQDCAAAKQPQSIQLYITVFVKVVVICLC